MFESRPLAGLASILLLVAVLGGAAVFGFSGTDLANTITRSADARAKDQQTQIDAQKAAVDLQLYRKKAAAEILQIRADSARQQAQAQIDLRKMEDAYLLDSERNRSELQLQLDLERYGLISLLGIVVLGILSLLVVFCYRAISNRRAAINTPRPYAANRNRDAKDDPWHDDPEWLQQHISAARQRERDSRLAAKSAKIRVVAKPTPVHLKQIDQPRRNTDLPWAE